MSVLRAVASSPKTHVRAVWCLRREAHSLPAPSSTVPAGACASPWEPPSRQRKRPQRASPQRCSLCGRSPVFLGGFSKRERVRIRRRQNYFEREGRRGERKRVGDAWPLTRRKTNRRETALRLGWDGIGWEGLGRAVHSTSASTWCGSSPRMSSTSPTHGRVQ